MSFESFDPLMYKSKADTDVAALALKREIREILGSYVGWYDPFSELIQNGLDSVDTRRKNELESYVPKLFITVNLKDQLLTVTDNGIGLNKNQFNQFLVPFFSFKSGKTRGHKGVGATYLAYGFNFIQVCTKSDDFEAIGKMSNARFWLNDESPAGNPEVEPDLSNSIDSNFLEIDKGVSITVKFDSTTHPKDLRWIGTENPESWLKVLLVKTGLGSVLKNENLVVTLKIIRSNGEVSEITQHGIEYLLIQKLDNVRRSIRIGELESKVQEFRKKRGHEANLPSSLKGFDVIFDNWDHNDLQDIVDLDNTEKEIIIKHLPYIYCGFAYSVKVFNDFNDALRLRSGYKIITGGFQIASNNMPQGEIYQIPLQRYIGRQNQIHFLIHFDNYSPDLGRKGYNKDLVDFCKSITEKITTKYLNKYKPYLRPTSGVPSDLIRAKKVADWKVEMGNYEKEKPLILINDKFFLPTRKISITSEPTREQDVIALFNQLIAGGVIRGIKVMSTNERFTYDGLYRVSIDQPAEHHIYDCNENPLGILRENIDLDDLPFHSHPEVLEYKFSLDGLIEDISDETKNSNDIGLVVVWTVGELYKGNYLITSLLDEDNLAQRQYHGVTHILSNLTTDQKEMDLIVLSDLIDFLNDPQSAIITQKEKYEEY